MVDLAYLAEYNFNNSHYMRLSIKGQPHFLQLYIMLLTTDFTIDINNNFIEDIEVIINHVDCDSYIEKFRNVERFLALCKECPNYKMRWSCPPYNNIDELNLSQFNDGYIIGQKIIIKEQMRVLPTEKVKMEEIVSNILLPVRRLTDEKLLYLESQIDESISFYAGSCNLCGIGECTRIVGEPCRHPDKIRPSLEALGFDISRTANEILNTELKWADTISLPEYYILISAIFKK